MDIKFSKLEWEETGFINNEDILYFSGREVNNKILMFSILYQNNKYYCSGNAILIYYKDNQCKFDTFEEAKDFCQQCYEKYCKELIDNLLKQF